MRWLAALFLAVPSFPLLAQRACDPPPATMPTSPVKPLPGTDSAPPYPRAMRGRPDTGVVRLRFVVCANGTVDPATIEVLRASHEAFVPAVIWRLAHTRYRPARVRAKAVSQVTELTVRFVPTPPAGREGSRSRESARRA